MKREKVRKTGLLREVKEETGLTLTSYQFRGIITFTFSSQGKETDTEYMCLYTANGYEGELISCSEGNLEWVNKKDVFSLKLWEGDKIFFRLLKEGRPFFSLKLVYQEDELKRGGFRWRKTGVLMRIRTEKS